MRRVIFALAGVLLGFAQPAHASDRITYFACKADNEDEASVFGLDETSQKVCDGSVEATWFSPTTFEAGKVIWSDGLSIKAIYRTGAKRYEHNFLLLVHTGHCDKVVPSPAQKCNLP